METTTAEPQYMTILETAKYLKCGQNRILKLVKSGLLERHKGSRTSQRGIIPYVINVEEARELLDKTKKHGNRLVKKLNLVVVDTFYNRVQKLASIKKMSVSSLCKLLCEYSINEFENNLNCNQTLQKLFIDKVGVTKRASNVFALAKELNNMQKMIREFLEFGKIESVCTFSSQFNTDETQDFVSMGVKVTYDKSANPNEEKDREFFNKFEENVTLMLRALLRPNTSPKITRDGENIITAELEVPIGENGKIAYT